MSNPWAADVEVTEELATRLIGDQFPALAQASVEPFGSGWDNAAFLVDGRYVFRFPRRAIAVPLVARELAVLPTIAAAVPLAVPVPRFSGTAAHGYPWPFSGYERLAGTTACSAALSGADRHGLAAPLGAFLRALHGVDTAPLVALGLPGDEIGRLDPRRLPQARERLAYLESAGLIGRAAAYVAALERDAPRGATSPPVVAHGDLYARHLLVDGKRRLCGVIDWGDVHAGDRAVDVAVAWLVLPGSSHASFLAAYGDVDEATWRAARYRAIYHAALSAHYGAVARDDGMLASGLYALRTIGATI